MSFLSKIFNRSPSELVTCLLTKSNDGSWKSTTIDGPKTDGIIGLNVDELIGEIEKLVANDYIGEIETTSAELQYAIYPWGEDIDIVQKITKQNGKYVTNYNDTSIDERTVADLVRRLTEEINDPSKVMLQMVQNVRDI